MRVITPDSGIKWQDLKSHLVLELQDAKCLFLGGTIDNGSSRDWQKEVLSELTEFDELVVLNPRKDSWDPNTPNDPTPGSAMHDQVMWEIEAQKASRLKLYHFEDGSMSPITLMELGAFGRFDNTIVSCSPKYFRYANVAIMSGFKDIPMATSLEEAKVMIKDRLKRWFQKFTQ